MTRVIKGEALMPEAGFAAERTVGRVVFVSNYRVSVLLDGGLRSQVRSYPHNIAIVTQIGGYLLFPVSPGVFAIGIIVGASEDEAIEPDATGVMSLQLLRTRRVLRLNLLGQLKPEESFVPGISLYPTLDTPALLPTEEELRKILSFQPPKKLLYKDSDKDSGKSDSDAEKKRLPEDQPLSVGLSPIYGQEAVTASYNDLLSRPLAVVGNTGSGKSCTVARIIQEALRQLNSEKEGSTAKAKFIILDINGEYSKAFPVSSTGNAVSWTDSPESRTDRRELNAAYVNGEKFQLPLWAFNLAELISFFEASQASQVPVLERVITELREDAVDKPQGKEFRRVLRLVDTCNSYLDAAFGYLAKPTDSYCGVKLTDIVKHLESRLNQFPHNGLYEGYTPPSDANTLTAIREKVNSCKEHSIPPEVIGPIEQFLENLRKSLDEIRQRCYISGGLRNVTADSPVRFDWKQLLNDTHFYRATERFRGQERMQEYLATLRLRIHRQLSDKRWSVFTEDGDHKIQDLVSAILGGESPVAVIDCSMLSHDVLPFFCAVIGRILLDLRARNEPPKRTEQPFVLVLEEAHNYLKPSRQDEPSGLLLAREAFERIAKEGRKFGLSLIIASQRPSDVSATVLSQCANFLIHRIQNPDDIEYFKRILPLGSRDLLDQLPILAPGEGLLIGSAVNVPTRVRVGMPEPPPESETSRPWRAWQEDATTFDIDTAVERWLAETARSERRQCCPN